MKGTLVIYLVILSTGVSVFIGEFLVDLSVGVPPPLFIGEFLVNLSDGVLALLGEFLVFVSPPGPGVTDSGVPTAEPATAGLTDSLQINIMGKNREIAEKC